MRAKVGSLLSMAPSCTLPMSARLNYWSFHINKLFFMRSLRPNAELNKNVFHQYKCCSSIADKELVKDDKCSKFEKMVRERRRQIRNSVLIHIYSKHLTMKLYRHCQQYGNIARAYNYSLEKDKDFALFEFENEESVKSLLADTWHFDHQNVIPVPSRCLWYHDKQHNKDDIVPAELRENGPPSDTKIVQELQQANSVSHQMTTLHELLTLSDLGQLLRFFICHQIETVFAGLFSNCIVLPFGSTVNGFGKFDCDLDMVMSLGEASSKSLNDAKLFFHTKRSLANSRVQTQRHLETISDIIANFLPGCSAVQRILQARVPIIKFHHDMVDTDCDLSLNNLSGVYMSELLYLYGEFDSRVRPLVFTILKWAKHNGLTHESPGRWVTNFSLILMVVFFLQTRPKPLLPSMKQLQKLADESDHRRSEGIECTFLRDLDKFPIMHNEETLSDLLVEFFNYFIHFDFKHQGLSIIAGTVVTKPDYSPLYIQNPFETELNVSKNISGEELVRIQEKIKTALWKLETSSIPSSNNIWGLLELFDVEELRDNDSMKLVRLPMAALFDKGTIHKLKDDMSKVAVPSLQLKPVSQTSESVNSNSNRPNPKKESLSQTSRNTVKKTDTVSQSEKSSREVRQTTRQVKKNVRQKILSKSWKF